MIGKSIKELRIGIAGVGMVGGALKNYFEKRGRTLGKDLLLFDPGRDLGSLEELNKAEVVFICVPTPFVKGKGFDLSYVEKALENLTGEKIVILKSTMVPGTTEKLQKKYPQHKILFNPEFLTEVTAEQDMDYPDRQIVGYTEQSHNVAGDVMQLLPLAPFESTVPAFVAEFCKYGGNTWFSVKVSKNNEFYDLFKKFGGDDKQFEILVESMAADKRIGRTHLTIWHKGYRGYGDMKVSKCLPKDAKALLEFASKLGVKMPVLEAADKYNDELSQNQDLSKAYESKRDDGVSGGNN